MRSPSRRARRDSRLSTTTPHALAAHVAVGRGVERLAAAVRRQHGARWQKAIVAIGREHQVHAAGQGDVALPVAQALARQVDRDQRRRAGGVDGEARAAEVEDVGDAGRRRC